MSTLSPSGSKTVKSRFLSPTTPEDAPASAEVALLPVGYEHLGLLQDSPAGSSLEGEGAAAPAAEDAAPESSQERETLPEETDANPPECEFLPPEDVRLANPNPFGFSPPPDDALCTMALVSWVNTETGETWTAPSGGYTPPSEAWVVEENVDLPPEPTLPLEPMPRPLPVVDYHQDPILGEDGTVIGYLDTSTWELDGYRSTSIVEYDAAFNVVSTYYFDDLGYWSFTLFSVSVDEQGNITGYEQYSSWGDASGGWGESVNVYDASWQFLRSDYRDSWGNVSSTRCEYAEDGSLASVEITSSWTDSNGVVSEWITMIDGNWRTLSTEFRDGLGTTVFTQYIYDETGENIALETTSSGVDENGEAWTTYSWQSLVTVDPGLIDGEPLIPVPGPETEVPGPEEYVPELIICEPFLPPETVEICVLPLPEGEGIPAEWLRPAELIGVLLPEA